MQNDKIIIKNASIHNLKDVNAEIPYNSITVITGVSGSGKSSLAFDTLYAEGQRRFVESLSSYARQFLERMARPDVEKISGMLPAVAINQKTPPKNNRSTVGTATEIYDYIRLLYGRIGETHCGKCGRTIHADTPQSIVKEVVTDFSGDKVYVLFPIDVEKPLRSEIDSAAAMGFNRIYNSNTDELLDFVEEDIPLGYNSEDLFILADRLIIHPGDEDSHSRLFEAVESALNSGKGHAAVKDLDKNLLRRFSTAFECADCGISYLPPEPRLFSFNNPYGACPECQGYGQSIGIDENLVIPDKTKTLSSCPVAPWKSQSNKVFFQKMVYACSQHGISLATPYQDLSDEAKHFIWYGSGDGQYSGIYGFFSFLEKHSYKIINRIILSKYRGYTKCKSCGGARLAPSGRQVFVGGKTIPEIVQYPMNKLYEFFDEIQLDKYQFQVVKQVCEELMRRIKLLIDIGLNYLTLDRLMHTLSGGEAQRISLASAIGSALSSTMYVLDEPSIGLHPRDTVRLLNVLDRLKKNGNTVVVVEHDPDIIKHADYIIDMGPRAGELGGKVCFAGKYSDLLKADTLTADYLSGRKTLSTGFEHLTGKKFLTMTKPRMNNLRMDEVKIPLNTFCCITGVSGSGKSTLICDQLFNKLYKALKVLNLRGEPFEGISGYESLDNAELVDQTPLTRSTRSTPITYTEAFDAIRELFASTQQAKQMGYKASHFSFNMPAGRCEVCEGEGVINVDMQFLPDVQLVCEACGGTRYKKEVREILYRGKSIVDVLEMTVDTAIEFFAGETSVVRKLRPLQAIGLGYLHLGQSVSTLSGGETQRVKLSMYLDKAEPNGRTLFIFDEPTTGLHPDDIDKLLKALRGLVAAGHSVIVIEHNLSVIANADWVIDLGPEGGFGGGLIVAEGTPYHISECTNSYTGQALKEYFKN